MENIASSLDNFYSDYNQSGSGSTCQDSSHTVTSLQRQSSGDRVGIHEPAIAAQQRDLDGKRKLVLERCGCDFRTFLVCEGAQTA